MTVKGVELSSMEAKRFTKDKPGNVRVDHNVSISAVHKRGDDSDVEFSYTVTYGHLGMIRMEGHLYVGGTEVFDQWSDKKKLENKPLEEIYNVIMDTGSYEAIIISKKLQLPPPIPLKIPRIKVEKGKTSGKAVHGPEVA